MPPKASSTNGKEPKRRGAKKKTANAAKSLDTLTKIRQAAVKEYCSVERTDKNYTDHMRRFREFHAELVKSLEDAGIEVDENGICTEDVRKALDESGPNEYSAILLVTYITQKCFTEDLSESYAIGIHAAACRYWDTMNGTTYVGPYKVDEASGVISGCPARAPCVTELLKACKTKAKKKGASATRNHAEAMPIEDLEKLMRWSERVCSREHLDEHSNGEPGSSTSDTVPKEVVEHGSVRAFASTAFTLWTRCFELLTLNYGDITWGCKGPAPHFTQFFKVLLDNRKGWQKAAGYDGPRQSCTYNVYEQKDNPEMDMYTHLQLWLKLYESQIGRKLEPDDFLFPYIAPNGAIHPKREMSYMSFAKMLQQFTQSAGLTKTYTTHSFHRGGSQYRFMFAPFHSRWNLNRIRWWGGWAIGENVDTLIKYLVDSLQSYENDQSDSLNPVQSETHLSFMGDHALREGATATKMREFKASINHSIDHCVDMTTGEVRDVKANLLEIQRSLNGLMNVIGIGTHQTMHAHGNCHTALVSLRPTLPIRSQSFVRDARTSSAPYPSRSPSIAASSSSSSQESDTSLETTGTGNFGLTKRKKKKGTPPIGEAVIPDIIGGGSDAWKQVVKQWIEGEPEQGLHIPLKDWRVEWYTGEMKDFTGSKRQQRELIGEEYIRLGRTDKAFLEAYPEDKYKTLTALKEAIRARKGVKRRKSRRGSPEERNMDIED